MSPGELRNMMIVQEYEENWENKSSDETVDDVDEAVLKRFYENATSCGRFLYFGLDKIYLCINWGWSIILY